MLFGPGPGPPDVFNEEDGQGCAAEHEGESSTFP